MPRSPGSTFRPGQIVAVRDPWQQQNKRRHWLPVIVRGIYDDDTDDGFPWAIVVSPDRTWDLAVPLTDLKPWQPWFGHKRPTGLSETH